MRLGIIAMVASGLALAQPAVAQPINSAGITRGEVTAFFKAKGYPVTAAKDDNDLSILKSTTPDKVNFDIYFFDCNDAGRCQAIQFAAGWSLDSPVQLDKLNVWNREHRYMRAYVQDGPAVYGEIDLLLAPGGSMQQLESYRLLWNTLLGKFKVHFGL